MRLLCLDVHGLDLDFVQTQSVRKHLKYPLVVGLFIVSIVNQRVEVLENLAEGADPTFVLRLEIRLVLQPKLFEDLGIV